ncbi:Tyrosine-protein kinase receptor, partial [Caligus rogercresseyi]
MNVKFLRWIPPWSAHADHQLVLPDCKELPVIGTSGNYNCVRLGIPGVTQLIKPHGCFRTVSVTSSGRTCKPWHLAPGNELALELVGGHNYCRNPGGTGEQQPWCYTNGPT